MGGSVAVTLRDIDGTVHKMCRSTNNMPFYFCNEKLYQKDRDHIARYLDWWHEFKAKSCSTTNKDGESVISAGKSLDPVEAFNIEHGFLAPVDYGLVVIDLMSETILSHQGYTSFDYLLIELRGIDKLSDLLVDPDSEFSRFKSLVDAKRVTKISISRRCGEKYISDDEYSISDWSFDDVVTLLRKLSQFGSIGMAKLFISPPFKLLSFSESDPLSLTAMKHELSTLNFEFSVQDEEQWAQFEDEEN